MGIFSRMQSAVRNLFHKQQVESELDAEVRAYVEMVADERVAAGMSPAEARRTALAEAGGMEQVKQSVRESRAGNGLELLWQDARYGLRQLRRNRAFTITAVLTLGLGIGATTTIFSAVYSLMIKPLPYPDAGRLVYLSSVVPTRNDGVQNMIMSPDYVAARNSAKSFEQLAASTSRLMNLTGAGTPVRVTLSGVTANFLPMLGATPQLGRLFTSAENKPGGPPVIILSDRFWRSQFNGDAGVIGRSAEIAGVANTVIGVMPRQFNYPSLTVEPDIYSPEALDPDTSLSVDKPIFGLNVVGLLKPNVSMQQAQAEMQGLFLARVQHDYPSIVAKSFTGRQMIVEPLQRHINGDDRKPLYILLICVAAVLLISCANVANLQLSRAVSRRHETALRGALGASRLRLVRQFLVESLILSSFATAAGLGIAFTLTSVIRHASVPAGDGAAHSHILELLRMPFGKLSATIEIDGWVLAFAVGLALLTTVMFGLAPAVSGSRADLRNGLQSAALRMSSGREQRWMRHALLVGEVAMAVVLLASAGLLVRSFVNVLRYDSGFDPNNLLTATTLLNDSTTPEQVHTFLAGLMPRLQALPGVESAAVTSALPLQSADGIPIVFQETGVPPLDRWKDVTKISITPDYFRAIGTALFRGRAFNIGDDQNTQHVAIVNRVFEKQFFSGNALGKRFRLNLWGKTIYDLEPVTIVGVSEDVRHGGLEQEIQPNIFLPESQSADGEINIVLRTFASVDPDSLANAMRKAVLAVDAKQPLFNIETMEERVSGAVAERRMIMLLISCFAMLAVVLSAVGVYGVFAYSVSQRSHEMGIRLALGATRRGLLRLVMLQAARLIAVGGVLGMVAALLLSRLLASLLVGVTTHDALSFLLAWGLMTVVAMLASMLPAADAARTDLLSVLHSD